MKISFVGDLFISRRITEGEFRDLEEVRQILSRHDCNFGNLETTILNVNEGAPALFPGGGYAMAEPGCLDDLLRMGFNLFNAATNHAMDYGEAGCLRTVDTLRKKHVAFAGIGEDMEHASAPTYLNIGGKTIALISVTSSFHDSYAAGPSNVDIKGRPGVSPLRHKAVYTLPADKMLQLKEIAELTGINSYHDMARKFGYLLSEQEFKFGSFSFIVGKQPGVKTMPNELDLTRTISMIEEAKCVADFIIVSCHSHQFKGQDRKVPPEFVLHFSHAVIDAGANMVVCHGPHVLRGIEGYNGGLILHGLGNFIFQHEQQKVLPEDFYNKYGMTRATCSGPRDVFDKRSNGGKVGIIASIPEWQSCLFSVDVSESSFEVDLYPIEISKASGLPTLSKNEGILKQMEEMSLMYDVAIAGSHVSVKRSAA